MIEKNKIYLQKFEEFVLSLDDDSIDLIISDPPYFRVKGDFDFNYDSFQEYQQIVKLWAKECHRVLSPKGSLFWYGSAKNIAYSQIILDDYFNLENSLVWHKIDSQNRRADFTKARCFAPVTERILFYSKHNPEEIDYVSHNSNVYFEPFDELRLYLRESVLGIGTNEVANHLGVSQRCIHQFISKSQWRLPSEERYRQMNEVCNFRKTYAELKDRYDKLKKERENSQSFGNKRRHFNNELKITDVLEFHQETNISRLYNHPTQKPTTITKILINSTTRKGDTILVPFVGSGSECEQAALLGRTFIGCEIDVEYFDIAEKRINKAIKAGVQENIF